MEPSAPTPTNNNNVQQPSNDVTDGTAATSPGTGPGIRPEDTAGPRYGVCKWFNVAKGWGFITPNDGGVEVFVHQSAIQMGGFRSLAEQEEVEFECKVTGRGLEATRVSGCQGNDCHGSTYRPRSKRRFRRVRCYNCGEFANHIASECQLGPQPKSCHLCKQSDHLFAECPQKDSQRSGSGPKAPARAYSDASNSAATDIR